MRQRIEEILSAMGDRIAVPTEEQIDRAEAAAVKALGAKIHQPVVGGVVVIAVLAILMNQWWIFDEEKKI